MKRIILLLLAISGFIFAQEDGLQLGGYLETKLSWNSDAVGPLDY